MNNKVDPQNNMGLRVNKPQSKFWLKRYAIVLIVSIVIAISIFLFINRETLGDIETYRKYGYLGIFLMSLICNATVFLPVGGALLTVFFAPSLGLNPAIIGLVGACGASLGELSGYMAGFGGQAIIKKQETYKRIEKWMKYHGFVTLVLCSFVAVSFDIAGLVAGAFRYPIWKFFLASFIGRSILYVGVAYLGAWGVSEIIGKYIIWAFSGITIVFILVAIVFWRRRIKTAKSKVEICSEKK
ncbi:MAG: VTT domain-containing protein [Chloroflexi bacterium]|nr:VTT domain-containing protein [Chloroflexota bacterium]